MRPTINHNICKQCPRYSEIRVYAKSGRSKVQGLYEGYTMNCGTAAFGYVYVDGHAVFYMDDSGRGYTIPDNCDFKLEHIVSQQGNV